MSVEENLKEMMKYIDLTTYFCHEWNKRYECNDFNEDFFRQRQIYIDQFKEDPFFLSREANKGKDLMLLPHPMRLTVNGLHPFESMVPVASPEKVAGAVMNLYQRVASGLSFSQAFGEFFENLPEASEVMEHFNELGHGSNLGNFQLNLMVYSWVLNDRPTFQIEDMLAKALTDTDFAADTPCEFFRSPLPFCFIEFGQDRDLGIKVFHEESGDHELEGCYINEYTDSQHIKEMPVSKELAEKGLIDLNSEKLRRVELTFIGSPVGKDNVMDDATRDISLVFDDSRSSEIGEMLKAHLDIYKNVDAYIGTAKVSATSDEFGSEIEILINYLVTVLLFINSSAAVRSGVDEFTPLLHSVKETKNKGKLKKKQKRLRKARQHILIRSTEPLEKMYGKGSGTGLKSAHWRRGHLRKQKYGKGLSETKIIFISPTLIGSGEAKPKGYKVR